MKKSVFRWAAATAVVGLFATMAPLSAFAATSPSWDTSSDAKVYFMNNDNGTQYADGAQMDWNISSGALVVAAPVPGDLTDLEPLRLPAPTSGVNDYIAFVSPVGSERTKSTWKQWGDSNALGGLGALLPQAYPGYLGNGTPAATKAAGGTYSMGIAYMTNNDLTVVKAYYTTINVDAGTGTWAFATPAAPTTVATTTRLAADRTSVTVRGSLKLTATVSPSGAPGSVQFRDGTTSLGNSTVSSGTAAVTVVVTSIGSHAYTATFTPNTSGYGSSTSSAVKVATVAKKFTTANKPALSGTAKVGKKLTAKVTSWNPVARFTYQWYANGTAIKGATKSTWKLAKSQKGKKITVKVTGSRADYASVSLTSKATAKVKK